MNNFKFKVPDIKPKQLVLGVTLYILTKVVSMIEGAMLEDDVREIVREEIAKSKEEDT